MLKKLPRFLKMKDYVSKSKENPDKIIVKIISFTKFKTEYSTNIELEINSNSRTERCYLALQHHSSANTMLLDLWNENIRNKNLKKGKMICLLTWVTGRRRNWELGDDIQA
jgi:hypothetical protein